MRMALMRKLLPRRRMIAEVVNCELISTRWTNFTESLLRVISLTHVNQIEIYIVRCNFRKS